MVMVRHTVQASLPMDLFDQLQRLRHRYGKALEAAGRGDYSRWMELRSAARRVGKLLADEARRSPEERGGLRLLDLSLAVDGLFPELRGFNQHETQRIQRQRLLNLHAAAVTALAPKAKGRAS